MLAVVVSAMWSAFGVSSSLASTGHGFLSSLSEAPPGTMLVGPRAVTVDRATGDVFVGDPATGMVDVYDREGAFVTQFGDGMLDVVGIGVDEATGRVYVADAMRDAVMVFGPDGAGSYALVSEWFGEHVPGGEFGKVAGVAVDNSGSVSAGDVYVVDGEARELAGGEDLPSGKGVVDVIEPAAGSGEGGEGTLVRQLTAKKMISPNGIAVGSSSGRVLVADSVEGAIYVYNAEGAPEEKLNGKGSPYGAFAKEAAAGDVAGVAIDGASGAVYVAEAERHAVSQYGPTGEWEGWITGTPARQLGEPLGVAVGSGGEVFVADMGLGMVDRFGAGVVVPTVETGKAAKSALTRTSALVPGTIDGNGKTAEYRFQYGETPALGLETTAAAAGTGLEAVSATLEPLQAGHIYYYRIVGEDEAGAGYGATRELETPAAVAGVETGPAVGVGQNEATLTGTLKREGLETSYHFQYGTTTAYGAVSPEPPGEVPAGESEKEEKQLKTVQAGVSGLSPDTVYHYRLVAENKYGASYGEDEAFTTSGPPQIAYQPVGPIGQTEATVHAQIDPEQLATSYRVQYGETTAYGSEVPGEGGIEPGLAPVAVSVTLPGLKVGSTYHYRVLAQNGAGITDGEDATFTTIVSAPVDATFATDVGTSEATLHTEINPLGHDTRYYFQYGTQSCRANPGACTAIPEPPGEDIGAGSGDVTGEATVTGLTPGTTYHYRVLDSNSLGTSTGPERTFNTKQQSALALADGRAWEMVSPPNKQGAPVEALTREGGLILASESGDSLTYVVNGALEEDVEGNRSPEWQQVLARRETGGWRSQDIATPSSRAKGIAPGNTPEYQLFSSTLGLALVEPSLGTTGLAEPPLAEGVKQATMYLRDNATGTYLPLVTEANVASGTVFGGDIHFVTATRDLAHVVIASSVALQGASSTPGLYEWSAGALSQVSVRPNGRPAQGLIELGYSHTVVGAVSNDGARLVWTTDEEEPKLGHLYLRDMTRGETVQVDKAEGAPEPVGRGTARFQSASGDGSRIFFTDRQRLTADSTAEPRPSATEQYGEPDLYVCEVAVVAGKLSCDLKDLTVEGNAGQHADVQGALLATSEDGTTAYFVAHGALTSNENGAGERARNGANNLYELHYDGTRWSTTFIAALSSEDAPEWLANNLANTAFVTARVSPNGRYLAFMSAASLTGYDNTDANPEANGARDEEVYLYDSQNETLRCASCNPSGARPRGVLDQEGAGEGLGLLADRRKVWFGHYLAGSIPGWTAENLTSALIQSRYLTNDGRLFFDSPADLVSAASNHREDVYEYEPSGVGSCESATGGCVSLLSGGSSKRESAFIEATPDGSNVFFVTTAQLLPQDTDTALDIYDARECTAASPCLSAPPGPEAPCAETETCRPAPPATQIPAVSPPSLNQTSPGNVVPAAQPAKHGVEARRIAKPTRRQKLIRALKSCRRRHAHARRKRRQCERAARRHYGAAHQRQSNAKKKRKHGRKPASRTSVKHNVRRGG